MDMPANYERSVNKPLADIPVVLSLENHRYTLAAVIIFSPPGNHAGIGHYTSAVRINNKFEVYDDLRPRTYEIDNTMEVCVHSLLYVALQK